MKLQLKITDQKKDTSWSLTLDKALVCIGRTMDADLCLPSGAVSAKHAQIRFNEEGLALLRDLSTNGTTLNGSPLDPRREEALEEGDAVGIAHYLIEVSLGEAGGTRTGHLKHRILRELRSGIRGPSAQPALLVLSGPRKGERHTLAGEVIVGRGGRASVVLPDASLSREQAIIHQGEGGTSLTELGSRNPCMINGQPFASPRPLHHGDLILLGETLLRYEHLCLGIEGELDEMEAWGAPGENKEAPLGPEPQDVGPREGKLSPLEIVALALGVLGVTGGLVFLIVLLS